MTKIRIVVIAMAMLLAFTGFAMAAYLPPETPETQTISTLTDIKCVGTVFECESATIMDTNQENPATPPLKIGEVVSLSSYSQDILAANGQTVYSKAVGVDTASKTPGNYNIETATSFEYSGSGAIFGESIYEMGASTGLKDAGDVTMCPFGKATAAPAFCNDALAKVSMMVTDVDFMSAAGSRSIAADAKVPAVLDYSVNANGNGVITIAFDATDIDSRTSFTEKIERSNSKYCKPTVKTIAAQPSAITTYHERTTAIGQWEVTKIISYQSGL